MVDLEASEGARCRRIGSIRRGGVGMASVRPIGTLLSTIAFPGDGAA